MRLTGRVRSLRGQITAVGGKAEKNLILNDQLINNGLRVTGFFIWPESAIGTQNGTVNAILSYAALADANVNMAASDNTQIGWCYYTQRGQQASGAIPPADIPAAGFGSMPHGFIDPDHIVNRDLFVSLRDSDNRTFNYMVICEFLQLTDDEAIVTIIKENSQSIE